MHLSLRLVARASLSAKWNSLNHSLYLQIATILNKYCLATKPFQDLILKLYLWLASSFSRLDRSTPCFNANIRVGLPITHSRPLVCNELLLA